MLDAALADQLQVHLQNITTPIELVASTDDGAKSTEMVELLTSIAELSDDITLVHDGADDRRPSFEVRRVGSDVSVTFAGIPMGHEFTSLVLALLQVGGHPSKADADTLAQIAELDGDFEFETFVSLSCQNCPDVVQALNLMSIVNPRIRHTMIDGGVFPDEVEQREIMAVPTVFLNGEVFDQGRMSLDQIVAKLDSGAEAKAKARLDDKDPFEVLIVGGGPAGASSAIYSARKGLRTGVVAERFGGQLNDTLGIENLIAVAKTEGPHLVSALEANVREHDVDVITEQSVAALRDPAETGGLFEVELANGAVLESRTVILATGARWRKMGVPGEDEYANRGVAYCPHCDGPLYKGKRVAVIGGGNSGIEAAIDLAGIAGHVTVLEFADTLRADDVLIAKAESLANVDIIKNAATTEVVGDGSKVVALEYQDRSSDELHRIELEGIFVQIGLLPNTDFLSGVVKLSERNEVEIDAAGRTSMPGVFAAGDCTTVPYKQIVIAMGQGSTALLSAFDHLMRTSVPVPA
ncbi:MAG: alkyl hydroperoxide reductase subunit F [Acidimicrobiales bacterium]